MCGTVENLEAHHIVPKAVRPDLCAVLENGLTLCTGCHRTEPWAVHRQPQEGLQEAQGEAAIGNLV
jgi:hypothetical protein